MPPEAAGDRLDRFLVGVYPDRSRTLLADWVRDGLVAVEGARPKPGLRLEAGWVVLVDEPEPPTVDLVPQPMDLPILFADEAVVVLDKPAGLVVHPGAGHPDGTLVNGLLAAFGTLSPVGLPLRPGIVHRLDRFTSGVIVVARTEAAHHHLARQFSAHTADRRYWAIAWDHKLADAGTVDGLYGRHPVDRLKFTGRVNHGKTATTHFRVLERLPPCCWLECKLDTGRTHQIRVHLSELGSPLVGDELYGRRRRADKPEALRRLGPDLGLTRQALHAFRLGFDHPTTGERMQFESPMPDEMTALLETLRRAHGLDA